MSLWAGVGAVAQPKLLTFDDIKTISPNAKDPLVQAIVDAEAELDAAGINTRLRMAHFLAQVMTETGGLKRIDENMNYSFKTLMRVFSRRTVSEAKAREIAGKPVEVANWVYGARLGNLGRDTQDGWNYRGSGFIQLTGRANFRDRGAEIGLPLEDDPELARQPKEGLTAAIAYWTARGINRAADDHDRKRVRVLVNGPAAHGLDQSKIWFNRAWTRVLRDKEADGFETVVAESTIERIGTEAEAEASLFDGILVDGGFISANELANESSATAAREEALRAYQAERGLPETAVLDEATQDALLDPVEWRHLEAGDQVVPAAPDDPEATVGFLLGAPANETGTESASLPVLEPFEGSGEMAANANIDQEIRQALTEASGIYSQYEMGGATVQPETFKPFSVIGEDERVAVTDTTGFPERAIVQILFQSPSGAEHLCSGAMVSKDTVLTAAHCIHSGTTTGHVYSNFRIVPGRNVGAAPFGRCNARKAYVLSGWITAEFSLDARYFDMGALKLDCDVGNATGWFGVRTLDDSELGIPTTVHGYAGDLPPPGRQWVSEDELRVLWELKGFYQNDTFGGTSGSPVYSSGANGTVIGVHTNGLHGDEPWASHNAFTRITADRLSRINEWIGDQ